MWKYKFSKVFNKVNTTIAAIRDFGRLVFTHVCTCLFFFVSSTCYKYQSKKNFQKTIRPFGILLKTTLKHTSTPKIQLATNAIESI